MSYETIRPYEISLWTLQDSFISVLKPLNVDFQGQLIAPKLSLKNNVATLNFSIPAKYRNESGKLVDNPLWYNVSKGYLLVNLRKIKVILNKGEEGEEVFEFVIHKAEDVHRGGQLFCEVEAEWLVFEELGKIGYKLNLNYDEYIADVDKKTENSSESFEMLPTLNYWADKIFANSNWTYSIQMDWSGYDGNIDFKEGTFEIYDYANETDVNREKLNASRQENGLRRRDKVYEEEYVSSWRAGAEDKLIPQSVVGFQEKARLPEIEKSNLFNITQELAELFGVFVKYKYHYDENYHIIKRECIFYNTFLDEIKPSFDINYGYQSSEISRVIESADVITKLYIPTTEDNSIIDVTANKSKEDYILNFDYLYMSGAISEEQYNSIPPYETKMYTLNTSYRNKSEQIFDLENELVKLKSEKTFLENSVTYCNEQIAEAERGLNSLTDNGMIQITASNPQPIRLLPIVNSSLYKVELSIAGILPDTIHIYSTYDSINKKVDGEITSFSITYDSLTGINVSGLTDISSDKGGQIYLVCDYRPTIKYENIKKVFADKRLTDESKLSQTNVLIEQKTAETEKLKNEIISLLEELNKLRRDLEVVMGPAMREGSWDIEDDYLDYGDRYSIKNLTFNESQGKACIIFDKNLFEGEQQNYYETGINQNKIYYEAFEIDYDVYDLIKDDLEKYTLYFEISTGEGLPPKRYFLGYDSSYTFVILNTYHSGIKPFLMITDHNQPVAEGYNFKLGKTKIDNEGVLTIDDKNFIELDSRHHHIDLVRTYSIVYPRIEINSDKLKTSKEDFKIYQNNGVQLEEFKDFSLLKREDKYYASIKVATFLKGNIISEDNRIVLQNNSFDLKFALSNSDLHLYLDALEVARTNAFPKVSYTVKIASVDKDFMQKSYQKLNQLANINDSELKLRNVQGYISEIVLNLDQPWLDEFIVQNYKTKFEDLFSRIVASTETMRQNQVAYDRASSAFSANGTINGNVLQSTLNSVDLNYAFNNGNLLIDEEKGIWALSDQGAVAIRGGGIFCATQKDIYDNWIWHSGITPSGINASILNAGVIDTNLIRIYSGDNLRFQMNADGLFAYSQGLGGDANYDKYVVHNSEGLFLTEQTYLKAGDNDETTTIKGEKVDLVEISWDGLILRKIDEDGSSKEVFYADPETGDLTIEGKITASTGNIGEWEIDDKGLVYKVEVDDGFDEETGEPLKKMEIRAAIFPPVTGESSDGEEGSFPYSLMIGDNFSVAKDGTLTATNAIIKGNAIIEKDAVIKGQLMVESNVVVGGELIPLNGALKRMDVISIGAGNTFKQYNHNLDDNITTDPSSLRFLINQMNFSTERKNLSFKVEGEDIILSKDNHIYWEKPESEELVFIVNYKFMTDATTNDDGAIEKVINISCDYTETNKTEEEQALEEDSENQQTSTQTIETSLRLTLEKINVEKRLSQINPSYHGFSLLETEIQKDKEVTFKVALSGFNAGEKGAWYLNNNLILEDEITNATEESNVTVTAADVTGSQAILRYVISGVSREAIITKTIIPVNPITLVIRSTNGTVFKNGNIATQLIADLYQDEEIINEADDGTYTYQWFKNGEELQGKIFRILDVEDDDFENKAIYTCNVYKEE